MKKALTVLLLLTAATAFGEAAGKTASAPAAAKPQREAAAGTAGSAGTAAGKAASPQKTAAGKGLTNDQLVAQISRYAAKTRSEAMAEAVADYRANGSRAKPLSQAIWKILKRELG